MDTLLQDLRFTARTLRRQPGFAATVVLTLALASGANSAGFTLLHGILLRPLPFPTADRLASLSMRNDVLGVEAGELSVSDLDGLRAGCSTCAAVAGVEETNAVLDAGRAPERLRVAEVGAGLFRALGIGPVMGRDLSATPEASPEPEILVSHRLWRRRLGEDPGVLGRQVLLDGEARTVVGIMPPGFHFPERADLWGTLVRDSESSRTDRDLDGAFVLRDPAASLAQLRSEVAAIGRRLAGEHPSTHAGWQLEVATLRAALVGDDTRRVLYLMSGAVFLVLLIACANVANLLLSRQVSRRHEVAIRAALGCGRWRIARQLLTESLVLSVLGGGLGVLLAAWSVDYVRTSSPEKLPYWMRLGIHGEVLLFTLGLSVFTALVISVLPAWRNLRPELYAELRRSAPGAGAPRQRQRLQRLLVVGQIALAVVLVFGAGLLIRTSMAMLAADPGFDSRNLVTLRTILIGERYRDPAARAAWLEQAIERLEALPGVERAAFTGSLPLDEGGADALLAAEGQASGSGPAAAGDEIPGIVVTSTAGYFDALGAALERGRPFTAREARDPESRVAIVGSGLADRLWPDRSPIGQRLRLASGNAAPWLTVVGVARDLHYGELGDATPRSRRQVHLPYAGAPWRSMTLVARTAIAPRSLLEPIREQIAALDRSLAVYHLQTLDDLRYRTTWGQRIRGQIFGGFALIALLLGAVGVYGVMSFTVLQRTREVGVRMALGADRASISWLVLLEGLGLAAAGVGAGLIGTSLVSRLMESLVWGVGSTDTATFVTAPLVLLVAALVASYLPARRAASVDPLVALRSE